MEEWKDANRHLWDTWTGLHEQSAFYNVEGFRKGGLSLRPVELEELAPLVKGKTLLHLMCHFGLDTLSWARLGAQVTGADLSDESIRLAQRLSAELNIPARFIASDLYALPERLAEQFDIVYTSYGVLHWLPDLARWGQIVAGFLKPGGLVYIVEDHPFMRTLQSGEDGELHLRDPYFYHAEPAMIEEKGSYASGDAEAQVVKGYIWDHSLGEILNALIGAGLSIEYLHEWKHAARAKFPMMKQEEPGFWRLPQPLRESVPLLFSLAAHKPTHPEKGSPSA